jgi:epoxyqueuosine reductase QueG
MFLRNAVIAAGNSDDARLTGPLRALQATAPALAEEIAWALGQIDSSKSSLGG